MNFNLTLKKQGASTQYIIEVGRMKGSINRSTYSIDDSIDDSNVEGGTDLTPIIKAMTTGDKYDVYVGTVATESNKLGFDATVVDIPAVGAGNTTKGILFRSSKLKTGSMFSVVCQTNTNRKTKLCVPNCTSTGIDTDVLADEDINSMSDLKRVLGKFQTSYQTKETALYRRGMWTMDTAFLVNLVQDSDFENTHTWLSSIRLSMTYANYNLGPRSAYISLRSYWNWYSMLVGEFRLPMQYVETANGDKIYLTLPISGVDDDYLFYDNQSNPFFENLMANGKPSVAWDYQSGTNLLEYVKTPNQTLTLKNGSILRINEVHIGNTSSGYYYTYELINNQGDNDLYIKAAFNVDAQTGDMIARGYSAYIDSYRVDKDSNYDLGINNPYYSSSMGNLYLLRGVYLMETPYEEAGVVRYADDNAGESASFFNQYPTTPVIIAGCYTAAWLGPYKSEGNWSYRAAHWGYDDAYADLMVSNIAGYNVSSSQYENRLMNMFTTCNPSNSYPTFVNGGSIKVDSATGFKLLFGIITNIDPEPPTGGGGSIGGGGGGSQEGGNGSYDDEGDNIGFSLGSSFSASDALINWYYGDLGEAQTETNLNLLGGWLSDEDIQFDGSTVETSIKSLISNSKYTYMDKLNNLCSLKVIYTPGVPAIAGPYVPRIHGQVLTMSPGDVYPSAYKVTNQFKQEIIRLNFELPEYFGSFLDYEPYTKIQIYLPFAGVHDLNASDIVGKSMSLHATVDFITGDIVYNIRVNNGAVNSILYTFTGNAAVDLPLSATDYSGKISGAIQTILGAATVIGGIATAAETGGASLAIAGGAISAGVGLLNYASDRGKTITKGSLGGTAGAMSPMQCYLIVNRPKKVEADDYGAINGYPCMKSYKIGDLEGFIQVHKCNWSIPGATEEELNEIEDLMSSEGAII